MKKQNYSNENQFGLAQNDYSYIKTHTTLRYHILFITKTGISTNTSNELMRLELNYRHYCFLKHTLMRTNRYMSQACKFPTSNHESFRMNSNVFFLLLITTLKVCKHIHRSHRLYLEASAIFQRWPEMTIIDL